MRTCPQQSSPAKSATRSDAVTDNARWHGLLCRQARGIGAHEARLALAALQALDGPAALPAARLLEEIAALYDLPRVADVLLLWSQREGAGPPQRPGARRDQLSSDPRDGPS